MTDGDVFELGNVELQSGATLRNARLVYKTYGQPNTQADNAILVPRVYGGRHGAAPSKSNGVSCMMASVTSTTTLHRFQQLSRRTWKEMEAVTDNEPQIELRWGALGEPFAADVPSEPSGTGAHRMVSVLSESADASITVNGRRLPSVPVPRPFLGRTAVYAFLAFSETWIAA